MVEVSEGGDFSDDAGSVCCSKDTVVVITAVVDPVVTKVVAPSVVTADDIPETVVAATHYMQSILFIEILYSGQVNYFHQI